MLKFIGGVVLIGSAIVGLAFFMNYLDVSVHASATQHAKQDIQRARNKVADEIRGK